MADQSGPAGRGLAGPEAYVIGQVLAEPVGQVLVSPGGRELAAEVAQSQLVDLDHPVAADRIFLPGHRPGEHPLDVRVTLLRRPGDATDQGRDRQVRLHPVPIRRAAKDGSRTGGSGGDVVADAEGDLHRRRLGVVPGRQRGGAKGRLAQLVGGHWVGQQRDAPNQRLGCIHRPGIWHAGGSEKVVEPPAALQAALGNPYRCGGVGDACSNLVG